MFPIIFLFLSFLLHFGLISAALIGCGGKKNAAPAANAPGPQTTPNKTNEPVKTAATAPDGKTGATGVSEDPDLKSRSNYNVKSDGATVPGTADSAPPA
uniref:Uncharacterized protein n=1 Tax=Panagrolaimus sp. PS1159 TaxID=55785 RepID=A0AC35FR10_9BILA